MSLPVSVRASEYIKSHRETASKTETVLHFKKLSCLIQSNAFTFPWLNLQFTSGKNLHISQSNGGKLTLFKRISHRDIYEKNYQ